MAYAKLPNPGRHPKSPQPVAISKMTDADLHHLGIEELIQLLRKTDSEKMKAIVEKGNIMKDINQKMQTYLSEIRSLKDVNKKLQEENQELRDLCCFLDDDRQKGRKLAKEWQRFGRYTSSVMKSEVSTYQDKLKELETQQAELMKENLELKELCIYLDQDLKRYTRGDSSDRDQGDGSSNSSAGVGEKAEDQTGQGDGVNLQRPVVDEHAVQYIRKLEDKIAHLEDEKRQLAQGVERNGAEGQRADKKRFFQSPHTSLTQDSSVENVNTSVTSPQRPDAVVNAMKVLELHEQMEKTTYEEELSPEVAMDESEKALIRQMCNVVWKKLGDDVPGYNARF